MTWGGPGTRPPAPRPGRHRRPPRHVSEERIPTVYLADVVRLMRPDATSLDPARLGPGFDIDLAIARANEDADSALADWRAVS